MNTSTTNRVVVDTADSARHGSKAAKQRATGAAEGLARLFALTADQRSAESSGASETQATFQEALDRTLSTLTTESPRSKTQTKARPHQQAGAWDGSDTALEPGLARPVAAQSAIRRSHGDTLASASGQDQEVAEEAISRTRAGKTTRAGGSIAAADVSDHTVASGHSSKNARKSRSSAEATGSETPQADKQVATMGAGGQGARPDETPAAAVCAEARPVEMRPMRVSAPVVSQPEENTSRISTVDLEPGSRSVQAGPDLKASSSPVNRHVGSRPQAYAGHEPGANAVTLQAAAEAGTGAKEGAAATSRIEADGQVNIDGAASAQEDGPVAQSLQKAAASSGVGSREAARALKTASAASEGLPDAGVPRLHPTGADRKDVHAEASQASEGPGSASVQGQESGHSAQDAATSDASAASSSPGLRAGPKAAGQMGGAMSVEAAGDAPGLTDARPSLAQQGPHSSVAGASAVVQNVPGAGRASVQAGQEVTVPEESAGQPSGLSSSKLSLSNRPVQAVDQTAASRERVSASGHDGPVFWQMEQAIAAGQPTDASPDLVGASLESSDLQKSRQGQGVDLQPMPEQVLSSIRGAVESGSHQLTVELDPPELGKVTIRLEQHGGGLVGVLEVDRRSTAGELEKALPQIVHNLSDSGVQVRRLEVAVNDRHPQQTGDGASYGMYQGRSGQQDQGQHTPHADPLAYSSSSPATTGDSAGHDRPQASLGSGGSIDLLM
jgi:flagellar hook-length control protein FliK